jgi:hypothetical protein
VNEVELTRTNLSTVIIKIKIREMRRKHHGSKTEERRTPKRDLVDSPLYQSESKKRAKQVCISLINHIKQSGPEPKTTQQLTVPSPNNTSIVKTSVTQPTNTPLAALLIHPNSPSLDIFKKAIYVIALKNSKKRFFLPSKQNSFGGFSVEPVMVDNGCGSHLLPLNPGDLEQLLKQYPPTKHLWSISGSTGVSSSFTLIIKSLDGIKFPVKLCQDFDCLSFSLNFLRFHLCIEDFDILTQNTKFDFVVKTYLLNNTTPTTINRRHHALIGQDVITDGHALVQVGNILVIVDHKNFNLDWYQIQKLEVVVAKSPHLLPANFNDLEDEDHDYEEVVRVNLFEIDEFYK